MVSRDKLVSKETGPFAKYRGEICDTFEAAGLVDGVFGLFLLQYGLIYYY